LQEFGLSSLAELPPYEFEESAHEETDKNNILKD
jgi:chromosome segregation and condensation protein ScpB